MNALALLQPKPKFWMLVTFELDLYTLPPLIVPLAAVPAKALNALTCPTETESAPPA